MTFGSVGRYRGGCSDRFRAGCMTKIGFSVFKDVLRGIWHEEACREGAWRPRRSQAFSGKPARSDTADRRHPSGRGSRRRPASLPLWKPEVAPSGGTESGKRVRPSVEPCGRSDRSVLADAPTHRGEPRKPVEGCQAEFTRPRTPASGASLSCLLLRSSCPSDALFAVSEREAGVFANAGREEHSVSPFFRFGEENVAGTRTGASSYGAALPVRTGRTGICGIANGVPNANDTPDGELRSTGASRQCTVSGADPDCFLGEYSREARRIGMNAAGARPAFSEAAAQAGDIERG